MKYLEIIGLNLLNRFHEEVKIIFVATTTSNM